MCEIKKYVSMGCQKALEEDQRGPKCIQKAPQRAPKIREATKEIQK